jgi:hypothetical protein
MHNQNEQDESLWGARINTSGLHGARGCPTWANPAQRERWRDRGLVLWDHRSHQITGLSATHALQILNHLRTNDDWKQHGIIVGEPATQISLDDPEQEAKKVLVNQMSLNATQSQGLFDLLQSNETLLQQMAEKDERERQRRLRAVYEFLLNLGHGASARQIRDDEPPTD